MAETNKTAAPGGVEQPAPEVQADNQTAPSTPDIGKGGADIPPWETPATDIAAAPGAVVVPSNVIDGLFEGKQAAAQDAEKQAAEQDKVAQEIPAAGEDSPKKGRGGRPPKAD